MARNGSGTYSRVANTPYVYNTVIDQVVVNAEMDDIATALTNSVAKDGQTTMTGNLPMGTYKLTGLGAGSTNGDSVRYEQLSAATQGQGMTAYTTGGSSTAYTLTPTPALTALATNQRFRVNFHTAAGATPTLAISGLTAKNLKYKDSAGSKQAITSSQVPTGWISDVEYDGTDYVVLNVLAVYAALAGSSTQAFATANLTATGNILASKAVAGGVSTRTYNSDAGAVSYAQQYVQTNNGNFVMQLGSTANGGTAYLYSGGTGGMAIYNSGAYGLTLGVNSTAYISIGTTGKVGIGMAASNLPLAVVADENGQNLSLHNRSAGDDLSQIFFRNNADTNNQSAIQNSSGTLNFCTGAVAKPTVPTIRQSISATGQRSSVVASGSTLYDAFDVRASVNFNGTGTPAINEGKNVTSLTDNGTGDYTVNFTAALPSANYALAGTTVGNAAGTLAKVHLHNDGTPGNAATTKSTTACRITTCSGVAAVDCSNVSVIFV